MKKLLTIIFVACCICSCKTIQLVPVTETKTEYKTITEFAHDTLIVRDSMWMQLKGDTIYIDRWHTRDRVVVTNKVDSFIRVDTIPQITEVQVPVRYRSGYDRFCSWFMWIVIFISLCAVAWKVFKAVYLRK